jgi:hypothetical protein
MSLVMSSALAWLSGFGFTELVEVPLYSVRRFSPAGRSARKRVAIALGASLITHPFVWFLFPRLFDDWWAMLFSAEAFAVIVEALWLRAFGVRRPLSLSLAANASSLFLGLWSREMFGWP